MIYRKSFLFILVISLCACKQQIEISQTQSENQVLLEETSNISFPWLLGDWIRIDDKPDQQTYESWSKVSESLYHGVGYTLKNQDTIFKETMNFELEPGGGTFRVFGVNENPTPFKITSYATNSFSCYNAENEFPNEIQYHFNADTIQAKILGSGMEVPFTFIRSTK